jgi:cell wall-associated NlpC family hydrolase
MAPTQRDLASTDLWLRSARRDLGDPRLWVASHHRSLARRNAAQISRRPSGARAGVALAVTAGAVAAPAVGAVSVASADSGLAAVQRALGVTADGQMGPQTRTAIRRFQRSHGLPVVGVAGPRTQAALGLDGDAASTHASLRSTGGSGSSSGGSSVADVQRHLGIDADGVVGPQTRSAIRSFQSDHGLPATGRLDSATRSQILQADPPASSDDSSSSSSSPDTGSVSTDTGTGTGTTPAPAPTAGVSVAVAAARTQIGKPYQSAGKGPSGFDCSGLTAFAFKAAGISLGASSYAQYGQGTSVSKSQIQSGDLVFFNTNGGGASHVGIATGPSTMISATTHGVMESSFTSGYWAAHYVGARRVTS